MSFGIADIALHGIILDGLDNLRRNPHHLEFILNKYCEVPWVRKRVGPDFIKNAMEMITKNSLIVRPYYAEDIDTYPCLVIAASFNEDQQFLGDYGREQLLDGSGLKGDFTAKPLLYAKFDAISVDGDELKAPSEYKLDEKLFVGVWVTNGKVAAKVNGIQKGDTVTTLMLDRGLPTGTVLKGWEARSLPQKIKAELHSSLNAVTVQMSLMTSGDPELHRVYAQVIRYCLKRGRQYLEAIGLQTPSFSQQPHTLEEPQGPIFRTVFQMECVEIDEWIFKDYKNPERLEVRIAVADTTTEDDEAEEAASAPPQMPDLPPASPPAAPPPIQPEAPSPPPPSTGPDPFLPNGNPDPTPNDGKSEGSNGKGNKGKGKKPKVEL